MVKRAAFLGCLLLAVLSTGAMAAQFIFPPETYSDPGEWFTPYPYQRDALIDFGSDPHSWPTDQANLSAYDLLPGVNYDLEGTLDPVLYPSDWITITGEYTWLPTIPGTPVTGILWIDNLQGTGPATVTLTWHLDNTPFRNQWKDVWSELVWVQPPESDLDLEVDFNVPPAHEIVAARPIFLPPIALGGDLYADDIYVRITPNPEWEELILTILVQPGQAFGLASWQTATECTPEPSTMALLGLGVGALFLKRRSRKV